MTHVHSTELKHNSPVFRRIWETRPWWAMQWTLEIWWKPSWEATSVQLKTQDKKSSTQQRLGNEATEAVN